MKRHKLSKRYSKRNFRRTAMKVHKANLGRMLSRGGYRI